MSGFIDWSKRAEYIRAHHGIETASADQAVRDAHAAWLTPDPASRSGHSTRVIGYSVSARTVLTVILLDAEADPSERPDGGWWGANAWASNPTDRNLYGKEESHEQD